MNMNKDELLLTLSCILTSDSSIKNHVDEVYSIRQRLDEHLDDEERTTVSNKIKARVQKEAEHYWNTTGKRGAILMATGVGKSKVGVDLITDMATNNSYSKALIVVPTEKLRDNGWPEQLSSWGFININDYVEICCYASLNKYYDAKFDLVIFDEGHNITPNNAEFFDNNEVGSILWMSATKPSDVLKIQLLKRLHINPVYEITLDEAVKLGLVAPYEIVIVSTKLNTTDTYIKAGSKDKPFMTTEQGQYNYLSKLCIAAPNKFTFIKRMRFLYNLKSKTDAAKWILDNVIPQDVRTLIFCGSKKEAIEICPHRYFSKPSKPKKLKEDASKSKVALYNLKLAEYEEMIVEWQGDVSFDAFNKKEISKLACVDALNEGHNIEDVESGLVRQLNGNELNLWQRIGRTIRFRPNYVSTIIIIAVEDTKDMDWTIKATSNLNGANIRKISFADLVSGKETISFN